MEDFLKRLVDAPVANILVVAGLVFLWIAVVGNVSGKIEPGKAGRVASAVLGSLLLVVGIVMHARWSPTGGKLAQPQASEGVVEKQPGTRPNSPMEQPTPAPQGFRIVETLLRADPFDHRGPCPVTIRFSGRISVAGGPGTVSYKFLRSDGASAPIETLAFDSPGSKDVSTTWTLGGPGLPTYSGWQAIQVLDPRETRSNEARFTIRCQ